MYASARFAAWPSVAIDERCGSISIVVTMLEPSSMHDMMIAAVASSFRVLRMRPAGRCGSSSGSPFTSGITATPVSKPLSPSASFGKKSRQAVPTASHPRPACSDVPVASLRRF